MNYGLFLLSLLSLLALAMSSPTCETRNVPFVLIGAGGVGGALLEAIVSSRSLHAERYGIKFTAQSICDSSAAVSGGDDGLSDAEIAELIALKSGGGKLSSKAGAAVRPDGQDAAAFLESVAASKPDAIIVDCTATDATVPALLKAGKAVSANKKPFADSALSDFQKLVLRPQGLQRMRYESSVGAGLPVIAALQRVVSANDAVSLISGSFSGTLGYVMSGLQAGDPFSQVVLKAKDLGYTEPDPRDDLGGVDVARKALILARTMGMPLEMSDVQVEPLYPPELAELSVPDFLAALPTLDASFAEKVKAAAAEGKVLRYAASVKPPSASNPKGSLTVGLLTVGSGTPLGTLSGSDNLVEIYTKWYDPNPLVVRGAGAGTGTTAAGVLSDMIELAFTRD